MTAEKKVKSSSDKALPRDPQQEESLRKLCVSEYFEILRRLKNHSERESFLKENLTERELTACFRRFQIALLLEQGVGWRKIEERLGVGFNKIIRVQEVLNQGGQGYKKAIEAYLKDKKTEADRKLEKAIKVDQKAARGKPLVWYFPQGLSRG